MNKITSLLIVGAFLFLGPSHVQAQLFTSDFTMWQTLGTPTLTTSEAVIASTDAEFDLPTASATAADIDTTLNIAGGLPDTSGTEPFPGSQPGNFPATNGQVIYLSFYLPEAATVTFDASMSTNDYYPNDSVGYILGDSNSTVYTALGNPPVYNTVLPRTEDFGSTSLNLETGSHVLGFVAYNTNDEYGSTTLTVTDITAVPVTSTGSLVATPEPSVLELSLLGLAGLFIFRKFRRSRCVVPIR
jgi:hypothetical protein